MTNFARLLSRRTALSVSAGIIFALGIAAPPAGAVISGGFGMQRRAAATINEAAPLQYHGGPVLHSSDAYAIYWDPTGAYRGDWKQLINGYLQGVGAASGTLSDVFAVNGQYRDGSGQAANESTFRGSYTDQEPYPTSGNCSEEAAVPCLTDQQIRTELQRVISSGALPGASGTPVYYVLTPPGVTVCTDGGGAGNCSHSTAATGSPPSGICGYHSAINPTGPNPTVYAVQPWVAGDSGQFIVSQSPLTTTLPTQEVLACQDNRELDEPNQLPGVNPFGNFAAGLADVIVNDLSIEQSNVVVDPLLNGWYQSSTNAEQGDMCQWNFGPPPVTLPIVPKEQQPANAQIVSNETINSHPYYVQWAFDSVGLTAGKGPSCWSGVLLQAHFTAPNPVNAGDVVGFDASESNITLGAHTRGLPADEPFVAPIYRWDFGDGTIVSGTNDASEFHSYLHGGTYTVTLTVTDSSSNVNSFTQAITVIGGTQSSTGSPSSSSTPTTTQVGSTPTGAPSPGTSSTPKPVATAAAVSRSLKNVLRKGLIVRYSVNEQVTGHFDVMIDRRIARRLGLTGTPAIGLPHGTAPHLIIAKAILVTTKGGRSTVTIQFSKRTAARLNSMHKLTLMLRLIVRNAASKTPVSTTVLSTVTLTG